MRSAGELPAQMYASAALCGLPHAAEKGVATAESIEEIERVLREALQAWLADTGARMPSPDPLWDRGARRERFEAARTAGAAQLEAQHAGFLAPAFEPNRDWWGSDPAPNAARL